MHSDIPIDMFTPGGTDYCLIDTYDLYSLQFTTAYDGCIGQCDLSDNMNNLSLHPYFTSTPACWTSNDLFYYDTYPQSTLSNKHSHSTYNYTLNPTPMSPDPRSICQSDLYLPHRQFINDRLSCQGQQNPLEARHHLEKTSEQHFDNHNVEQHQQHPSPQLYGNSMMSLPASHIPTLIATGPFAQRTLPGSLCSGDPFYDPAPASHHDAGYYLHSPSPASPPSDVSIVEERSSFCAEDSDGQSRGPGRTSVRATWEGSPLERRQPPPQDTATDSPSEGGLGYGTPVSAPVAVAARDVLPSQHHLEPQNPTTLASIQTPSSDLSPCDPSTDWLALPRNPSYASASTPESDYNFLPSPPSLHTTLIPPTTPPPTLRQEAMAIKGPTRAFLLAGRRAGMSYREIKLEGGFAVDEGTLRGRYRTITKPREQRVRKPKWTRLDKVLLERAVCAFADRKAYPKPWKHVADYIVRNGGSYQFGLATCRKKWDEIKEEV